MKRLFSTLLALLLLAACVPALAEGLPGPCAPGDRVFFGAYEQDGDTENGPEPVEWIVLDVRDGAALLLSRYQLAYRTYQEGAVSFTEGTDWEHSSIRAWLNGDFLKSAFTEEEAAAIAVTAVVNEDNDRYGTPAGADTEDRVFLLSIGEVERYFPEAESRLSLPTFRAILDNYEWQAAAGEGFSMAHRTDRADGAPRLLLTLETAGGAAYGVEYFFDESGELLTGILSAGGEASDHAEASGASYFLRSPGSMVWQVSYVTENGETEDSNQAWANGWDGIRPALWAALAG